MPHPHCLSEVISAICWVTADQLGRHARQAGVGLHRVIALQPDCGGGGERMQQREKKTAKINSVRPNAVNEYMH